MRIFKATTLLKLLLGTTLASALSIISSSSTNLASDIEGAATINAVSFQQDPLVTFGDYQYVAFYKTSPKGYGHHYVNLGRRRINPSVQAWQYFTLADYEQTTLDGHNVISMGISGDGKIHLSFDHHDVPLNYRVSTAGIAKTIPAWTASLFGPVQHSLPGSSGPWTPLTYPRFRTLASGDMLMEFRIGQSGSGDSYIHRYSSTTGSWTAVGKYLQGQNNNAYINGIDSVNNRLHVTWTVRETPDATTNHDFYYTYSDDDGRTWKNSANTAVVKPITPSTGGIKIYNIPQKSNIVNQEGQFVDSKGRVHALMRDSISGGVSKYYHYLRETTGVWSKTAISPSGLSPPLLLNHRGKVVVDPTGKNLIALLPDDPKSQIQIYASTEAGKFQDWKLLTTISNVACEPAVDRVRLEKFGTLSVYVRQNGPFPARQLQVWDFKLQV